MALTLVATPIGHLQDLSPRAAEVLKSADFWIVEDTRVSAKLAATLGVKKPMQVLNEHSSPAAIERYGEMLAETSGALVTDGGSPVISDPGTLLVDHCYSLGMVVDSIPGPSAVTNALALSGFFGQRFVFLGFLGRKAGAIRTELEPFQDSPLTIVLFESPFRFRQLLKAAGESLGHRRYAICREMTKMHQQIFRSSLPEIPDDKVVPQRGEFTIVIEGKRKGKGADNQM